MQSTFTLPFTAGTSVPGIPVKARQVLINTCHSSPPADFAFLVVASCTSHAADPCAIICNDWQLPTPMTAEKGFCLAAAFTYPRN
jgi:hypothetical protein